VSRLHGPEAGVEWTARAALAAVRRIAAGDAAPGFRTPALAFGADFALEADGVTREDLD
jgi:saccharopine dehydrogenase (NAD+, L-lysine-forming)